MRPAVDPRVPYVNTSSYRHTVQQSDFKQISLDQCIGSCVKVIVNIWAASSSQHSVSRRAVGTTALGGRVLV